MPLILLLLLLFTALSYAEIPPIQLATKYHDNIIVHNYWVSEKLDGVRAYWNGKQLMSRQGNTFLAPKWFTSGFPSEALDGELWITRGSFEQVSSIVRTRTGNLKSWHKISFMVFDLPSSKARFTERLALMQHLVDRSPSIYLSIIPQQRFKNQQALQNKFDEIIEAGGEGLMLHHIDAFYQVKRSKGLMKLKRYDDAEAKVLGYVAGKGKHLGRMGSLIVKNTQGITFKNWHGFHRY